MLLSFLGIVAVFHCKTGVFTRRHIAARLRERLQPEQSLAHCGQAALSLFQMSTKIVDSPCGKSLRGLHLSTVLKAVASTVSSGTSLVRNRAKHFNDSNSVHPVKYALSRPAGLLAIVARTEGTHDQVARRLLGQAKGESSPVAPAVQRNSRCKTHQDTVSAVDSQVHCQSFSNHPVKQ